MKVRIYVQGGVAYIAEKPLGVEVEIRDYDCDWCGDVSIDEEGHPYVEEIWEKDEEVIDG